MKKILLLIIPVMMAYAFDTGMAAKIYERLFHAVFQKEHITVYTVDEEYIEVVHLSPGLELTSELENADMALITDKEDLPSTTYPLVFTTDIRIYEEHPSAVGIFYWEHGRPKIIFSKERLNRFSIMLGPEWSKYLKSDDSL